MKQYIDNHSDESEITSVFGHGAPDSPVIGFADESYTIYSEQRNNEGRWRGWIKEVLTPVEYFARKLSGK